MIIIRQVWKYHTSTNYMYSYMKRSTRLPGFIIITNILKGPLANYTHIGKYGAFIINQVKTKTGYAST
ncbi:MAG: hypothetical protein ACKPKO_26575 [Candidatus Fonsibacter sp.]